VQCLHSRNATRRALNKFSITNRSMKRSPRRFVSSDKEGWDLCASERVLHTGCVAIPGRPGDMFALTRTDIRSRLTSRPSSLAFALLSITIWAAMPPNSARAFRCALHSAGCEPELVRSADGRSVYHTSDLRIGIID
jgi:hypothetical protein